MPSLKYIILIIVSFAVCLTMSIVYTFQTSTPYSCALKIISKNADVRIHLGIPISTNWWAYGEINYNGFDSGFAHLTIPIRGPDGRATARLLARKDKGQWAIHELNVSSKSFDSIDLVKIDGASGGAHICPAK